MNELDEYFEVMRVMCWAALAAIVGYGLVMMAIDDPAYFKFVVLASGVATVLGYAAGIWRNHGDISFRKLLRMEMMSFPTLRLLGRTAFRLFKKT